MYDAIPSLLLALGLAGVTSLALLVGGIRARWRKRGPEEAPPRAGSAVAILIGAIGLVIVLLPVGRIILDKLHDARAVARAEILIDAHLQSLATGPVIHALGTYSGMELSSSHRWSHTWDIAGQGVSLRIEGTARFARGAVDIDVVVRPYAELPAARIDKVEWRGVPSSTSSVPSGRTDSERAAKIPGTLSVSLVDPEWRP